MEAKGKRERKRNELVRSVQRAKEEGFGERERQHSIKSQEAVT